MTDREPSPKTEEASASAVRRPVSLLALFVTTTYFAVASLLAKVVGIGAFVAMTGAWLTWASFRGNLWWMQTKRARPGVFLGSWGLLGVSLLLPVFQIQGCGNGPAEVHYGHQVAAMPVAGTIDAISDFLNESQRPLLERVPALAWIACWSVFWNAPNLMVLASPWLWWRLNRGQGSWTMAVVQCATISSWAWGLCFDDGFLLVGYYVWSLAITLLSLACPPTTRTVWIMVAIAILVGGSIGLGWAW